MVANLETALYEITIFLLGLCGIYCAKCIYNKIVKLGQEKFAYWLVGIIGMALISVKCFI